MCVTKGTHDAPSTDSGDSLLFVRLPFPLRPHTASGGCRTCCRTCWRRATLDNGSVDGSVGALVGTIFGPSESALDAGTFHSSVLDAMAPYDREAANAPRSTMLRGTVAYTCLCRIAYV